MRKLKINLTLKSAKQRSFESAYVKIREEIAEEFNRHRGLLDNSVLTETVRERFCKIADGKAEYDEYSGSLKFLSKCLYEASGEKVIILLDEYDVPLENA